MKASIQFPYDLGAMLGTPYQSESWDAELLYESGNISLFVDETTEDAAANKSDEEIWWRNSLFLKRRKIDGTAGSRESSDRWNVFALKTIAAKLGTSVVIGVFVWYNCARCVRFRRERRVMRKKEKGRENDHE